MPEFDIRFADDFVSTIGIDVKLSIKGKEILFQNISDALFVGNHEILFPDIKEQDILFQYLFKNNETKDIVVTFNHEHNDLNKIKIKLSTKNDKIVLQNIQENKIFNQYVFKNGQLKHLILVVDYGPTFNPDDWKKEEID